MFRRIAPAALALLISAGCAGPARLAQRSEQKLAGGDNRRAWELAIRSLDKDPGNPRGRAAADAAGAAIERDWEQRIHALAQSDTMAAAEQVLDLASFRLDAIPYTVIAVSPAWSREEQVLRRTAARIHYRGGVEDLAAHRPKRAWLHFDDARHFVPDYRDAGTLADKAYQKALTRVAFVPFSAAPGSASLGRDVAAAWRDDLARHLTAPNAHFTRVLGSAAVEQAMSVSQLGHLSREDAIRLGRKAGADRVVWGSVGNVDSQTRLHLFSDVIARRIVDKNPEGERVTRWVDVPVEVVARVRTVTVDVDYEVIATNGGATLAHQRAERSTSARAVWTAFVPEGDLSAYALVSDVVRAAQPERAKAVESHWKDVCGETTTLQQVLEARRSTRTAGHYDRSALPRFVAGAAFVFLQDLPPAEDLALAALDGCEPLRRDMLRLDNVDDVDLGVAGLGDDR